MKYINSEGILLILFIESKIFLAFSAFGIKNKETFIPFSARQGFTDLF